MLKGEELINDAINSWLEKYEFDARIRGLDNDFYWGCLSDTITYSFVHTERFEREFMVVCDTLGLNYDVDVFWLSLLHELGHSETHHFLTDEEIDEAFDLIGEDYYWCEREISATKWAVDFVNQHIDQVIELMEMAKPAITHFFVVNNIEVS